MMAIGRLAFCSMVFWDKVHVLQEIVVYGSGNYTFTEFIHLRFLSLPYSNIERDIIQIHQDAITF